MEEEVSIGRRRSPKRWTKTRAKRVRESVLRAGDWMFAEGELEEIIIEMIIAERTHEASVRYTDMRHYWFRAVLDWDADNLRASRKRFQRAHDARAYRQAVLARLERLRSCK